MKDFDLHDISRAYYADEKATKHRDFSDLNELLRDSTFKLDHPDNFYVRELVASILDGSFKLQRGPKRPERLPDAMFEAQELYCWQVYIENRPKDAAKDIAAEHFGVTKRTVNSWLKKIEKTWPATRTLGFHCKHGLFDKEKIAQLRSSLGISYTKK